MGYHIELESITLEAYAEKLEVAWLPPSRRILQVKLAERFGYFQEAGIQNVKELQKLLKQPKYMEKFSELSLFRDGYLVILLREINSMLPKPNALKDFPGIPEDAAEKLAAIGIKDTKSLYNKVLTAQMRDELSAQCELPGDLVDELSSLADLSRIKWVSAIFARMLYDLGMKNVAEVAAADPVDLHRKVNELNSRRNYYKGKIGLNDMRILVAAAGDVQVEIV